MTVPLRRMQHMPFWNNSIQWHIWGGQGGGQMPQDAIWGALRPTPPLPPFFGWEGAVYSHLPETSSLWAACTGKGLESMILLALPTQWFYEFLPTKRWKSFPMNKHFPWNPVLVIALLVFLIGFLNIFFHYISMKHFHWLQATLRTYFNGKASDHFNRNKMRYSLA